MRSPTPTKDTPSTPGMSGSLGATPLAQLIIHLARLELTGTLAVGVHAREKPCKIVFDRGDPSKAYTPWRVAYLGEVLVRTGKIDATTHDQTLDAARLARRPHGTVLLERGLVDARTVAEARRAQTVYRLVEVFRRYGQQSTFMFYPGEDGLAGWGGGEGEPVDPWYAAWRGISSRGVVDAAVAETLSFLGQTPVTIRPDAPIGRFGFEADVEQMVRWLSENPMLVEELLKVDWMNGDRTKLGLYVLFLTHCLAFRDPIRAGESRMDPPRRFEPAVPRSGTMPRVTPSPLPRAPSSKPSPLPRPPSSKPSPLPHAPSSKPASRAVGSSRPPTPVSSTPPSRPSAPAPSSQQLEADRLLRKARRKRSDGELDRAEELARQALAATPSMPEVSAELALILALQPEKQALGDLGEPLTLAEAAIKQAPGLGTAHYARGIVHQALGFHEEAYKDFRRAVRANRPCPEALPQLEAYIARHRKTGALDSDDDASSRRGGVLSNLFK